MRYREIAVMLEHETPQPETVIAPDIGVRFEYNDATFMVTGWLKTVVPPPGEPGDFDAMLADLIYRAQQEVGPRKQKMVWCQRRSATHVAGRGVSGCIAPVDLIRVIGRVPIQKAEYDILRRTQMLRIGEIVF